MNLVRPESGYDENIDSGARNLAFKMESDGFTNVFVEFVDGGALGENVFPDPTCTPGFAVVVELDFDKHAVILALRGLQTNHFKWRTATPEARRKRNTFGVRARLPFFTQSIEVERDCLAHVAFDFPASAAS